jgi:hypothetical protein
MQAKKNAVEKALPGKSTTGNFQPAKPSADKTAQHFTLSLTCKNPAPISPGITTEKTVFEETKILWKPMLPPAAAPC